ncbi:MAG: SUMF1/EgtB/PvdO family nonheme iron enzyme [Rhodospirillales bacterium]|nr:SUMF1/EgtB/PvdO family nonheme iron enzyme [Rhodospirillales bacterium]
MGTAEKHAAADSVVCHDEPCLEDRLDRERYVKALAQLALTCQTPMVFGLYGGWGVGKTSMMLQIRQQIDDDGTPTVWFDPWRHQFDEDPIVALLQTMVVDLGKEKSTGVKEILTTVALALGSSLTKKVLGLNFDDYRKMQAFVAEEMFTLRNAQIRLREAIEELIKKTRTKNKRIVFFIDDLDRCLPANMLKMLEALKLYLNVKDCVYFLGLDHTIVRKGIEKEYAELKIEDQDYLDKIIQLPFAIPPIHGEKATPFIESLLPQEAKSCAANLALFLANNPRKVKRFVNTLALNLVLAANIFGEQKYNIDLIVAFLLIQHRKEALFKQIGANPHLYLELAVAKAKEETQPAQDYFGDDTQLKAFVQRIGVPDDTPLERYVYLADIAGAAARKERTLAIEPEMVIIQPGIFLMGSDEAEDEKPPHQVTIKHRLEVGKYPVTFAEYDAFCVATDRPLPSDQDWGRGRRPVINVSWEDAQAYCAWLSKEKAAVTGRHYRLLSEAEWEYACRAGTVTKHAFGDEITGTHANFGGTVGRTTEVGAYPANPWGLYDMHGNVWEWVEDIWHDSYADAPDDGSAWIGQEGKQSSSKRVVRGGSWNYVPGFCRSAFRGRDDPVVRFIYLGFRLARTLD